MLRRTDVARVELWRGRDLEHLQGRRCRLLRVDGGMMCPVPVLCVDQSSVPELDLVHMLEVEVEVEIEIELADLADHPKLQE